MSKLAKRVALVIGGSRGIGAAIAIELGGGKAIAIQADAANEWTPPYLAGRRYPSQS